MTAAAEASRRAVSEMLAIDDPYTAYCIDEAAFYVKSRIKGGEMPVKRASNRETAEFLRKGGW